MYIALICPYLLLYRYPLTGRLLHGFEFILSHISLDHISLESRSLVCFIISLTACLRCVFFSLFPFCCSFSSVSRPVFEFLLASSASGSQLDSADSDPQLDDASNGWDSGWDSNCKIKKHGWGKKQCELMNTLFH